MIDRSTKQELIGVSIGKASASSYSSPNCVPCQSILPSVTLSYSRLPLLSLFVGKVGPLGYILNSGTQGSPLSRIKIGKYSD